MVNGSTRKIVVIKNVPSNIIEEAILILKNDSPAHKHDTNVDLGKKKNKKENDYLLKEAEEIINEYIKEYKTKYASGHTFGKHSFLKNKLITNTAINTVLIGSIILLLFIIMRVV